MNRILIIDDEPQIRRFLRISLSSQGYDVIDADTGRRGLELAALQNPHLIVLDLGLPDQDGQDVLKVLREFYDGPVMVLSVRDHEGEKVRALDSGANDYVTKPFGINEFLARARRLLADFSQTQPALGYYDDGCLRVDLVNRKVSLNQQDLHLSRKEFELLRLLLNHPGRIITQEHLLKEIWGKSHTGDTHYLRIFIAKLRNKLGDNPTDPHYIETEPGVGYRFIGQSAE